MKNLIRRLFRPRDRVARVPPPFRTSARPHQHVSFAAPRRGFNSWAWFVVMAPVWISAAIAFGGSNGCMPSALQTQRVMASTVAITANSVLPILLAEYRREILATVAENTTRDAAEAAHGQVVERWRPIWGRCEGDLPSYTCAGGAWRRLSSAHDAWALVLESEASSGRIDSAVNARIANELRDALCALYAAVPASTREELRPLIGARCDSSGGQ